MYIDGEEEESSKTNTEEHDEDDVDSLSSYPIVTFSHLSATDLTEMDPAALGGGSDPYIVFHTDPPGEI